jgi:hypothetical protein
MYPIIHAMLPFLLLGGIKTLFERLDPA